MEEMEERSKGVENELLITNEAFSSEPVDRRYPRPPWFRRLRWILIHWIFSLIILYILICLIVLVIHNSFRALLNTTLILNAVKGDQLISFFYSMNTAKYIGIGIGAVVYLVIAGVLSAAAIDDKKKETRVLRARELEKQQPTGFKLHHKLLGYTSDILKIAWSPDGHMLASTDGTIRLWNVETWKLPRLLETYGQSIHQIAWSPDKEVLASEGLSHVIQLWNVKSGTQLSTLTGPFSDVLDIAWSPNGRTLALGFKDGNIQLQDTELGQIPSVLTGHTDKVNSVAWSPDGRTVASGSADKTVRLWCVETKQLLLTLVGHSDVVNNVVWSPNGEVVVSGSQDCTIRLWNPKTGREIGTLENHTASVVCVAFSCDGRLLASKSYDGTVRLWRADTWEPVIILNESSSLNEHVGLAFHPLKANTLATLGEDSTIIRIWDLDLDTILQLHSASSNNFHPDSNSAESNPEGVTTVPPSASFRYTNAKVIIVGDSGVGKSGLGLVLSKQPFAPTESSHGRHIWTFDSSVIERDGRRKEMRETLLWDLAGQPGYRLIHQLHLNEVTVALVVLDGRSETDPFAGVYHWDRALRSAQHTENNSPLPMKKFLVAARMDRGGVGASRNRIDSFVSELGFDGYFETSAKEGWNIAELIAAIQKAIDWEALPWVSSTDLFQSIKDFLVKEKEVGRLLSTVDDLYDIFLNFREAPAKTDNLRAQFETCIGRVESRGLIRRLSFGKFVLLQSELLDAYASALVNTVKDEPDGLGSIAEERVRRGNFFMSDDERVKDKEQEKILLIAMIEDLLHYEIALREQGDEGPYLVFPSQSTREHPDLPDPEGKAVVFSFQGSVLNIYATLAVRLSHSGIFKKKELWKNAVIYAARVGGTCGMFLENTGEGQGRLSLFFDKVANEQTRFYFEEYIETHLKRRALPESIKRHRMFTCSMCGIVMPEEIVQSRLKLGFNSLNCPVCESRILLLDREERLIIARSSAIQEMDRSADNQRDHETVQTTLQGKIEIRDFDVFLCYNTVDRSTVIEIGERLKERGILPWLDEWELRPGLPWQRLLGQQIEQIKSAAVFVGKDGVGPWQEQELEAFLRQFVRRECPVIPVFLPEVLAEPELPIFLKGMTWVDFRKQEPDPLERLFWGITGKRLRIL
jgi:small GTP-binding protein